MHLQTLQDLTYFSESDFIPLPHLGSVFLHALLQVDAKKDELSVQSIKLSSFLSRGSCPLQSNYPGVSRALMLLSHSSEGWHLCVIAELFACGSYCVCLLACVAI